MSVRRPSSHSTRSRRSRSVGLFPEVLENRVVLSSSADPAVGVASAIMHTNYEEFHVPGSYPSWLTPGPQGILPQDNGSIAPFGYTPSQIRAAYGVTGISFGTTEGDGTLQTIAIVDAYDNPSFVDSTASNFSTSDLAEFDKQFGLPDPPSFTKYNQNGGTTNLPGTDPKGRGTNNWEAEEALDVEWAHTIAPGASIDLIECSSPSDLYTGVSEAATLPGVSVVSMSWGGSEFSDETDLDQLFTTPSTHEGMTFLASTGDDGSPGGYPAYSPNVVAVGGTSVFINPDNSYNGETGWSKGSDSWNPGGAGGGGISEYETPPPGYQAEIQTVEPLTGRAIPDVSLEADPATGVALYDSYNNGTGTPWTEIGGTSLATPMWAGLIAIANQGRMLQEGTTLNSSSNPIQTLSALYSLPPTDFHSITTGNNGAFNAGPGYNEVTGLGSPIANSLVPDLVAYGMASQLVVTAQPPPTVAIGQPFDLQISAEDSYGQVDHSYTGDVTLSGPALNGGSVTVPAINGVATFTGVSVNVAGDALTVTSGNLNDAVTNVINTDGSIPIGFTPRQILTAYGINNIEFDGVTGDGANQTIAIVDAGSDPFIGSDLAAFDAQFNLPAPPSFTLLNEYGGISLPAADPTGNWETEEDLDVEWAHSVAPGANLDIIECNYDSGSDSSSHLQQILDLIQGAKTAATLPGVSVVSMSWGITESQFASYLQPYGYGETNFDSNFTTPSGHEGVTFLAGAGDTGSANSGYPAFSPNVVAVGGTSLFLSSNGTYDDEIGWGYWTDNGFSGTGGGMSQYESEPNYQMGVQSTEQRTIPDVSFEADPNTGVALYDYYGYYYGLSGQTNPWTDVGGTSLAAPAWAGLIAIANQGRVSEGGTTLRASAH